MKPIPPQPKPRDWKLVDGKFTKVEKYTPAVAVRKGCYWLRGRIALMICDNCKNEQAVIIAYGFSAQDLTQEGACRAGQAMAWQTAPRVLCPFCKPERMHWLYYHAESDCIFWSDTENDTFQELDLLGGAKEKTKENAFKLWGEARGRTEFEQAYKDYNAPENPNRKGQQ